MDTYHFLIATFLWLGFFLTFRRAGKLRTLQELMRRTKKNVDEAARRRLLMSRSNLLKIEKEEGFWFFIERQLCYGGLRRRFPFLSAETFGMITLVGMALCFLAGAILGGILAGLFGAGALLLAECIVIITAASAFRS